jgi:hypothetical protein
VAALMDSNHKFSPLAEYGCCMNDGEKELKKEA